MHSAEISVRQNKAVRVGPVVGDVLFSQTAVCVEVAGGLVEPIHFAAIDRMQSAVPVITEVQGGRVCHVAEVDELTGGGDTGCGSVGTGRATKISVEGTVFLDDEDGVPDRRRVISRRVVTSGSKVQGDS